MAAAALAAMVNELTPTVFEGEVKMARGD